jgi:hypothetical protein
MNADEALIGIRRFYPSGGPSVEHSKGGNPAARSRAQEAGQCQPAKTRAEAKSQAFRHLRLCRLASERLSVRLFLLCLGHKGDMAGAGILYAARPVPDPAEPFPGGRAVPAAQSPDVSQDLRGQPQRNARVGCRAFRLIYRLGQPMRPQIREDAFEGEAG